MGPDTKPIAPQPAPLHMRPNHAVDMQRQLSKGYPEPKGPLPDAPKNTKPAPATGAKAGEQPFKVTIDTSMADALRHPNASGSKWLQNSWADTVKHHPDLVPENARAAALKLADQIKAGKVTPMHASVLMAQDPQLKDFLSQKTGDLLVKGIKSSVMADAIIDKDPALKNDPAKAHSFHDTMDKALAGDQAAKNQITRDQWKTADEAWIAHKPGSGPNF
jgi:hypothetical protein